MVSADAVRVNRRFVPAPVAADVVVVVSRRAVAAVVAAVAGLRTVVVVGALLDGVDLGRLVFIGGRVGVGARRAVGSVGVEGCGVPPSDRVDAGGCGCGVKRVSVLIVI